MTPSDDMAAEAKWYWTCVKTGREIIRMRGYADPEVLDLIEELKRLYHWSTWPTLRLRIQANMARCRIEVPGAPLDLPEAAP